MKTGQLIKELRLKKGITQEELAAKTDISVRTIQRIESGDVDPRAFTLQSIAAALEVEYEVLVNSEADLNPEDEKETNIWLPLLHLSGLLLLIVPPIILWIWKRDKVRKYPETWHRRYKFSAEHVPLPYPLRALFNISVLGRDRSIQSSYYHPQHGEGNEPSTL